MDVFEFMADSPILASVDEFLLWLPETTNTESAKLKAIYLYQDLLQFHKNDSEKSAFIDADLHRLEFGYNNALGADKDALYIAALEQFSSQWAGNPIVARAIYNHAKVVYGQGDSFSQSFGQIGHGKAFGHQVFQPAVTEEHPLTVTAGRHMVGHGLGKDRLTDIPAGQPVLEFFTVHARFRKG